MTRVRARILLTLSVAICFAPTNAFAQAAAPDHRARVEAGTYPIGFRGPEQPQLTLAQWMDLLQVRGISVAVIDDYRIFRRCGLHARDERGGRRCDRRRARRDQAGADLAARPELRAERGVGAAWIGLALIGLLHLTPGTAVRHVEGIGADDPPIGVCEPEFPLKATMLTGAWMAPGNRVDIAMDGDGTYSRLWEDLRSAERSIVVHV